jgi:hypothetical protein
MKFLLPKILISTSMFIVVAGALILLQSSRSHPSVVTPVVPIVAKGPQKYTDTNFGITLVYPEGWSLQRLNTTKTVFFPDAKTVDVGIDGYAGDIVVKVIATPVKAKSISGSTATLPLDKSHSVTITDLTGSHIKDGVFKSIIDSYTVFTVSVDN